MDFEGIGPGGKPGHDVEFPEQPGHHFVGIGGARELFEVGHHALQRLLDAADGLLGEILPLRLQALVMLEKFFAIKVNQGRWRHRSVTVGEEARETIPCPRHVYPTSLSVKR